VLTVHTKTKVFLNLFFCRKILWQFFYFFLAWAYLISLQLPVRVWRVADGGNTINSTLVVKTNRNNPESVPTGPLCPIRGLLRTTSRAGYFGDSEKHMSKCLHWSAAAMPAAAFRAAAIWGGWILLPMSKIFPPNIWGRNLNFLTEILSSPKISPPPIHNFGLYHQVRKTPLRFPMKIWIHGLTICLSQSQPPHYNEVTKDLKNNLLKPSACRLHAHYTTSTNMFSSESKVYCGSDVGFGRDSVDYFCTAHHAYAFLIYHPNCEKSHSGHPRTCWFRKF